MFLSYKELNISNVNKSKVTFIFIHAYFRTATLFSVVLYFSVNILFPEASDYFLLEPESFLRIDVQKNLCINLLVS